MRLRRLLLALTVAAAVPVVAYAATQSDDDASGTAAQDREPAGCDVVSPKPGSAISGSFGAHVTVVAPGRGDLVPPGTTEGRPRPNGAVYAKILWRRDPRRARGRMRVTGRRLDTALPGSLRATLNQAYSDFVPSTLIFSSAGCWSVTARSGKARVRYVVRVVNLAIAG